MNTGVEVALLVPVAYLLGTFPSATLVARRAGRRHHRRGLRQPGASNTFRLLGWKAGALVFAMDVLKGALAALAGLGSTATAARTSSGSPPSSATCCRSTRKFKGGAASPPAPA